MVVVTDEEDDGGGGQWWWTVPDSDEREKRREGTWSEKVKRENEKEEGRGYVVLLQNCPPLAPPL